MRFQQFVTPSIMRAVYINFYRMFDMRFSDKRSLKLLYFLQIISNIQLIQLLQIKNQNHFKQKQLFIFTISEIYLFIQFVSISGNFNIIQNMWVLWLIVILNVIMLFSVIYFILEGSERMLRLIQYLILIYCSLLEYPIISLMIQYIQKFEDFQENYIIYLAAINLSVHSLIQILQIFFGKSFSIDVHNNYNPLINVALNSFRRIFKFLIICVAHIFEDNLINLSLLATCQILQMYSQSTFLSASPLNLVQIYCQLMICFIIYLDVAIVQSLILITLTIGISLRYHEYLYYNLITDQCRSPLNIAYICSYITQSNSKNAIELFFILYNHQCMKCKNISDIQICLLKKLKLSKQQDTKTTLQYSEKISQNYPIKALIQLAQISSADLRIDYQMKHQCQILDLISQLNKKTQSLEEKDSISGLSVRQVQQSVRFYQKAINQYQNIIQLQIQFWKSAQSGFQTHYQCLMQMSKMAKIMLENKNYLKIVMQGQNLNVLELKVLQLHYAVVYLEQNKIYYYQKQIEDKIMLDKNKSDKNVNNKVLYEDRYLLVQTSLVFQRGLLINFQQQKYNQFFNLPLDLPNQIKRIEDLMPQFKRSVHNQFLKSFIRRGYTIFDKSGLDVFICNPEGYIDMGNLQVNYDNTNMDDVVLTGLFTKEQTIDKAILISMEGQILGMDKETLNIIRYNIKQNLDISELVEKGYLIQGFIKNIQNSIDLLTQKYQLDNQDSLLNISDSWINEKSYSQSKMNINQNAEREIGRKTVKIATHKDSEFVVGKTLTYNLFYVKHSYKGGEMKYFKIIIVDDDNQQRNLKTNSSYQSKNSQNQSDQASDSNYQIQNNSIPNQRYKFLCAQQGQQNEIINQEMLNEKEDFIITQRQLEEELINQNSEKNEKNEKNDLKANKQINIDQSLSSKRSSEDNQYLVIINNLYGQNKIIRPLRNISLILILTFIYTVIIIFVNQAQIQDSVNNQLNQIQLLRKPQNISYVYTSLSTQFLFKYAGQQGLIQLSPFMIYWNQVQQIYMQKYIETMVVQLNIEVPIIADSFNQNTIMEHRIVNGEHQEFEVSLQQYYDQIAQQFCLLRDDDSFQQNIDSLLNKGFIRENLIQLLQLNDRILKQINKIVTSLQQSEIGKFLTSILIEFLVLVIFYNLQVIWWIQFDKTITELILIVHRTQISSIELKIIQLQEIGDILQMNDASWMQIPIQKMILDTEVIDKNQKKQQQQLISVMPQDYYINKLNLIIWITILIVNILFDLTGYLIYQQANTKFQSSLSSMSNYVQFLHDIDCSFLYGGIIKMDGPLNGDQIYQIDQEEVINAFQITQSQLLPQLNSLQQMIYSSQLQDNDMFYELLFQNLCDTSSKLLVMCDTTKITQEYWQKDQYGNLIQNGIIGYTNQFIKYIKENYQYEFETLQYAEIEQSKITINQQMFQNLFLQYFLDMQETLRIFLKTFFQQNTIMGQDIVSQLQGYYIGFGIIFAILTGGAYYYWIRRNQYQIYLALQILGIIPNSHNVSQNFKSQILKLYNNIY